MDEVNAIPIVLESMSSVNSENGVGNQGEESLEFVEPILMKTEEIEHEKSTSVKRKIDNDEGPKRRSQRKVDKTINDETKQAKKKDRIEPNANSEDSKSNDWQSKLSLPLKETIRKINEALSTKSSSRNWPTDAQFIAAKSILSKIEEAKSYLADVLCPAMEESRFPTVATTISDLAALFEKDNNKIVGGCILSCTIVQRWNANDTSSKSTQPICFLVKQGGDFVILKSWNRESTKGVNNYTLLATLPIGAQINLSDFKLGAINKQKNHTAFFKFKNNFEVDVTNSNIKELGATSVNPSVVVSISELEYFRQFARLEVVLFLTTTKEMVRAVGVPKSVSFKERQLACWSLSVFDEHGSTAVVTFWERHLDVSRLMNHVGDGEILLKVTLPSSIKKFNGDLIINVREYTIFEIMN